MKNKFRHISVSALSTLTCFMLYACQPGEPGPGAGPEPQRPTKGTVTEVGKPIGAPIQKTIGPAGGSITTPDSAVTLVIPAGALKAETTISIQPTENKAWGGAGLGYQLTPKNLELSKPAEITWNYKDADVAGSTPEALGIAFQQPDNSWKGTGGIEIDRGHKKAKAKVIDFVPIAFYESYFMEPIQASVVPAEAVTFEIFFQEGHQNQVPGGPLVLNSLIEPTPLKKEEVKNWRVNGKDLVNNPDPLLGVMAILGNGASAQYVAPSKVPPQNEMAISVEVILKNTKAKLILVSSVTVEGANSFSFSGAKVDSAEVATIAIVDGTFLQITLSERHLSTSGNQALLSFSLMPFTGTGVYQVADNTQVNVGGSDRNRKSWKEGYYPRGGKRKYGPLSVTILQYDKASKSVRGIISGTLHYYDPDTDKHESTQLNAKFAAASPY